MARHCLQEAEVVPRGKDVEKGLNCPAGQEKGQSEEVPMVVVEQDRAVA